MTKERINTQITAGQVKEFLLNKAASSDNQNEVKKLMDIYIHLDIWGMAQKFKNEGLRKG